MADKEIQNLPAPVGPLVGSDIVAGVQDPAGTADTVKMSLTTMLTVFDAQGDATAAQAAAIAAAALDATAKADAAAAASDPDGSAATAQANAETYTDTTAVSKTDGGGETFFDNGASGAAITLDLANGNVQLLQLSAGCTITFPAPPAVGESASFTLFVIQGAGPFAITWDPDVKWAGGTAPTLSAGPGDIDVFTFVAVNGSATWYGFTAGQAMA